MTGAGIFWGIHNPSVSLRLIAPFTGGSENPAGEPEKVSTQRASLYRFAKSNGTDPASLVGYRRYPQCMGRWIDGSRDGGVVRRN